MFTRLCFNISMRGHDFGWPVVVRVVADDYPERQVANLEDRHLVSSFVDRFVDRRIQLAIDADDQPSVKDRCIIVESATFIRTSLSSQGSEYALTTRHQPDRTEQRGNNKIRFVASAACWC